MAPRTGRRPAEAGKLIPGVRPDRRARSQRARGRRAATACRNGSDSLASRHPQRSKPLPLKVSHPQVRPGRGSDPMAKDITLGRVDPRGFQPGPGSRYLPAFGWYYGRHREPGMSRFWQAELDWPDMWASVSAFRCRYCCRYCCRLLPRAWRRPGERRGHCGGVGGPRVADAAGGPEPGPVHGRLAERPVVVAPGSGLVAARCRLVPAMSSC
jgi:hypothetical protein